MLRLIVVKRIGVTLALTALLVGCTSAEQAGLGAGTEPSPSPSPAGEEPAPVPARTGPLGEGGAAASCAEGYNIQTIGNRAFAFDGTVTNIESGSTNRPDKGHLDTAAVTFRVNEWFEGGQGETVTVDLMAPTSSIGGDETPTYEPGTRLLVSGEPRWGGAALDNAIAWSCGGFTRYYEAAVADEWRSGAASSPPSPALLGVSLTCDRRNTRSAEGTVRGRVVDLFSTAPHAVSVVQGADATLGSVALAPADATGSVAFKVPVTKVQTEQPVRVVLRQSGVRSLSALVEVKPDAATCAEG